MINDKTLIRVLFFLCLLILAFSVLMIYENNQLKLENIVYKNKILLDQINITIPTIECSQLGFCIGDYVELNDIAMKELKKTIRFNGTVVKISDGVITFDEGNEEWRQFNEEWLRHYHINWSSYFYSSNYSKIQNFTIVYI